MELLSAKEAAKILNVETNTVYSYASRGLLKVRRNRTNRVKFIKDDVNEFWKNTKKQAVPEAEANGKINNKYALVKLAFSDKVNKVLGFIDNLEFNKKELNELQGVIALSNAVKELAIV